MLLSHVFTLGVQELFEVVSSQKRKMQKVIIGIRDVIAADAIITSALTEGKNVVSLWGAGHLPGIEKRLKKSGFRKVQTEWRTAFVKRPYSFLRLRKALKDFSKLSTQQNACTRIYKLFEKSNNEILKNSREKASASFNHAVSLIDIVPRTKEEEEKYDEAQLEALKDSVVFMESMKDFIEGIP